MGGASGNTNHVHGAEKTSQDSKELTAEWWNCWLQFKKARLLIEREPLLIKRDASDLF
jgi:hypothetical protein